MKRQPVQSEEMPVFIGIDYHKAYGVYNVLDVQGESLGQGRRGRQRDPIHLYSEPGWDSIVRQRESSFASI
jgi:hypothetical protein